MTPEEEKALLTRLAELENKNKTDSKVKHDALVKELADLAEEKTDSLNTWTDAELEKSIAVFKKLQGKKTETVKTDSKDDKVPSYMKVDWSQVKYPEVK
jgi:hypothetical protein